jgi:hypothetical protein
VTLRLAENFWPPGLVYDTFADPASADLAAFRHVSRNGQRRPGRPRIELREGAASPEEAAAIAAAIEQFLRDTAPPPAGAGAGVSPWLRAGLFEGTGRSSAGPSPWGDGERWGS